LGLARVYVYGLKDIDKAYAVLQEAERRGYKLGNREKAQLADGYVRDRGDRLPAGAGGTRATCAACRRRRTRSKKPPTIIAARWIRAVPGHRREPYIAAPTSTSCACKAACAFQGDTALLPGILMLTGIGLILMVSLRDPVRDNLLFVDFAQGVAAGAVLLAVASALDYERLFGKLSFVPLIASFVLSALLIVFGYGPGTSDAKVNLFGFQPVELIRLLLILFLAGYFAQRWDILRHAREHRPALARLDSFGGIPPLEYTIPVFVCGALSLLFFFLQKDMGPAMIFTCLFLALYSIARRGP
jgi:hypothetical protein